MQTIPRINTLTVVPGTMACNAKCPDCVAKMATDRSVQAHMRWTGLDRAGLSEAAELAIQGGSETLLITGNGEPTLYPEQVTDVLRFFADPKYRQFKNREMQTNGLLFQQRRFAADILPRWRALGLGLVSVSVVDVDNEINRRFYVPHRPAYPDLAETLRILKDLGFQTRLGLTLMNGYMSGPGDVRRAVEFCLAHGVDQLTMRPVARPQSAEGGLGERVLRWVAEHELTSEQTRAVSADLFADPELKLNDLLSYGAQIFTHSRGLSVCWTNCLSEDARPEEERRNLIVYPGGLITFDWETRETFRPWSESARLFAAGQGEAGPYAPVRINTE